MTATSARLKPQPITERQKSTTTMLGTTTTTTLQWRPTKKYGCDHAQPRRGIGIALRTRKGKSLWCAPSSRVLRWCHATLPNGSNNNTGGENIIFKDAYNTSREYETVKMETSRSAKVAFCIQDVGNVLRGRDQAKNFLSIACGFESCGQCDQIKIAKCL